MKIDCIDVMIAHADERCNPFWRPVFCRITADNGLYGDGEAAVAFAYGPRAAYGALQDMAPLILGRDPLDIEGAWNRLYYDSFWAQNGGLAHSAALSAIEMALWDICGKHHGVPVHELLGGKKRDRLKTYASQLQNGWSTKRETARTPQEYAENALRAIDQGYDTVKIDFLAHRPGHGHYEFSETGNPAPETLEVFHERMSAVRAAVGVDVGIAVEGHAIFDVPGAIAIGKIGQSLGALFFEEPTTSFPELVEPVRQAIDTPLALGERVYTRWGFTPYVTQGLIDFVQPDTGTCGGILEARRICELAHEHGIGALVHDCGTPLLNAATLNLEATLPNFALHEHHVNNLHEYNKRLCVLDYQPENGFMAVPETPGIGNVLSPYALEHSTHFIVR